MSNELIDIVAVRAGREELAALVSAHPELTSPEAQDRLASQLGDTNVLTLDSAASTVAGMAATSRRAVNIRLEETLIRALEATAKAVPVLSRHALCRAALHIGLAAIQKDPAVVLKQPVGASQGKAGKAGKKRRKRSAK